MTDTPPSSDLADPLVAAAAQSLFGDRLPLAQQFALRLAGAGVERGLLGPREVPRLWQRHLINCAAVAALLPRDARVVDVGSGAGLPGLVLAVLRPDLQVDLVEPMLRRATFLTETVEELGLHAGVTVHRGRAEDPATQSALGGARWVTARAVAPLDRLVTVCLPLLRIDGELLALKGAAAPAEVAAQAGRVRAAGGSTPEIMNVENGAGLSTTVVVRVRRVGQPSQGRRKRRGN